MRGIHKNTYTLYWATWNDCKSSIVWVQRDTVSRRVRDRNWMPFVVCSALIDWLHHFMTVTRDWFENVTLSNNWACTVKCGRKVTWISFMDCKDMSHAHSVDTCAISIFRFCTVFATYVCVFVYARQWTRWNWEVNKLVLKYGLRDEMALMMPCVQCTHNVFFFFSRFLLLLLFMMLLILAYCCRYFITEKWFTEDQATDSMDFRFKRYIRVCLIFYAIQVARFSACSKMLSGLFILDFVCMRCDGKFNDSLFSFDATALGQLLSTIYSWSEKIAQKKSETLYFVVFTRFMHKSGTHIYIQYSFIV